MRVRPFWESRGRAAVVLTGKRIEAFGGFGADGRVGGLCGLAEMKPRGGPIVHGFG